MQQNKILLLDARTDYMSAVNILKQITTGTIPTTIEDIVYAYMVAKDCRKQIADSNTPSCKDNLLDFSDTFNCLAKQLEQILEAREHELVMLFMAFNPNLISKQNSNNKTVRELTRMHIRSMAYIAAHFTKKQPWFTQWLESNSINISEQI